MTNVTHKFLSMYLFLLFNSLHVSSTSCSSSGETNCINTASGNSHSVSVAVSCASAHDTATNTEWQLPEFVLIQFVSPDDEHDVLETCRELNNKNKYIERNLCVTLIIYQKSLHDARSTKYEVLMEFTWRYFAILLSLLINAQVLFVIRIEFQNFFTLRCAL